MRSVTHVRFANHGKHLQFFSNHCIHCTASTVVDQLNQDGSGERHRNHVRIAQDARGRVTALRASTAKDFARAVVGKLGDSPAPGDRSLDSLRERGCVSPLHSIANCFKPSQMNPHVLACRIYFRKIIGPTDWPRSDTERYLTLPMHAR